MCTDHRKFTTYSKKSINIFVLIKLLNEHWKMNVIIFNALCLLLVLCVFYCNIALNIEFFGLDKSYKLTKVINFKFTFIFWGILWNWTYRFCELAPSTLWHYVEEYILEINARKSQYIIFKKKQLVTVSILHLEFAGDILDYTTHMSNRK